MPKIGNMVCRTVLVVEDADACATTLEIAFSSVKEIEIRVMTAAAALELLRHSHSEICALVTDLNMPRMDGFELIQRVRGELRLSLLPIIVISGDTGMHTAQTVRQMGANAFFGKPFSPAEVRSKLEQLIHA